MAAAHGHDPHHDDDHGHAKGGHAAHAHPEPAEDPMVTPGWMPLVGLGLLVSAALGIYLFLSPGVLATPADAGAGDGGEVAADAAAAH